jgi:hypothetical protein
MQALQDTLRPYRIASLQQAARTAGVDQRTLLKIMAAQNVPIIALGPRKRGLRLSDFDRLISSLERQPVVTA